MVELKKPPNIEITKRLKMWIRFWMKRRKRERCKAPGDEGGIEEELTCVKPEDLNRKLILIFWENLRI